MSSFMSRARSAWHVLLDTKTLEPHPDHVITSTVTTQSSSSYRYDTTMSVLSPIMTRIAIDAAQVPMYHVNKDLKMNRFDSIRDSELNDRLTIMANIDQTGKAFIQDAVMTLLEDGYMALVPVEISANPRTQQYEILSLRVGRIQQWFNKSVEVEVYNEMTGDTERKILPKSFLAICISPLYAVMNQPNSTLRRLIDKLALLDVADARLYSSQLDLILQLPYALRNDKRVNDAENRLQALESQLKDRTYGVAYIDSTEKVTQLNRPVTNSLVQTIDGLTASLHAQLGLTPAIFSGEASQEEILLYNSRTISPILDTLMEAMIGAFLSRTAISQGQSIMAFPNLFKMASLEVISDAADKLTRNQIMSSNEIRVEIGLPPSDDPEADELRNKNLNKQEPTEPEPVPEEPEAESDEDKE